ncbi:toxin biosynthesis protein [Cladophialophora carrionii]|uniref:Toxin biosynthesis protein n=1 Tax=Cladophialophora carrionii TaxID=86049 RepID=A0A1C1CNA1_9EURO|nr:toxin biosynthesis protein [Cladophialophora carrionii]
MKCVRSIRDIGHVEQKWVMKNDLKLAVKQYVPYNERTTTLGDVTFIAAHANGFPKELYEPMFDDLYEELKALGRTIRAIWIADLAHQGQSYVLNEKALGNDRGFKILHLHEKSLELIKHSELGLILIDPVIQTENPSRSFAKPSTYRRDIWTSRDEARAKFENSKFYRAWDSRVFEQWMQYGLRDLPTEMYPDRGGSKETPVTLKTPKSQEVFSYLRPKYYGTSGIAPEKDWDVYGDMHPDDIEKDYPFYRPESAQIFRRLPELKPPVLYIFGKDSELATPELRRKKMETTGTGVGGSGGSAEGKVKEVVLNCGHLVPMERSTECAAAAASFAASELARWEEQTRQEQAQWLTKPRSDRVGIDDEWRRMIGPRDLRNLGIPQ